MAITNMGNKNGIYGNRYDYLGESTDIKPTEGIDANSMFLELDTGDIYYFDGSTWAKVGGE